MKTPSIGTLVSSALNVILSLWLISNYFYDEAFRNYVNITISQVYPFMILTMGLGGGSGLGYLLLRRRHPEKAQVGKLQTGKLPRHITLPSTPYSLPSISQSKSPASGTASAQPSKHTIYAVPPLGKSAVPGSQRPGAATSWSTASKQPAGSSGLSVPLQRSESNVMVAQQPPTLLSPQSLKPDHTGKTPIAQSHIQAPDQSQLSPIPKPTVEPPARAGPESQWKPEPPVSPERKSEAAYVYPRPSVENVQKPETPLLVQRPAQPNQSSPAFAGPKWTVPESGARPGQWTDPVPKQPAYSPSQKWVPPEGNSATPQPRPPGMPLLRPMQPPQSRQAFPQPQGPPRPLAHPGLLRPPEPGSGPGPRPLRPDQATPSPGSGMQPRPSFQGQRPASAQWGPTPSPVPSENRDWNNATPRDQFPPSASNTPPTPVSSQPQRTEQKISEGSPAGEMDWDTALDTILKTLRKDKVVEKS